jgi:hypothetical protein
MGRFDISDPAKVALTGRGWCGIASNVPVEPGNDLPAPDVICVRGFAR